MSLVRHPDMSTNSSPGLSAHQLYNSDKNNFYMDESFELGSYDPNYVLDSPSEELVHPSPNGRYQSNSESDYLEKLHELEHVLFDDNDDVFGSDNSMELVEGEWGNDMVHDSPKESSSLDSNISSISSRSNNKEVSVAMNPTHDDPKALLFECASAISDGRFEDASNMINELRQMVSIHGEPSQRIAAYMVEGLAARLESSGKFLYKALKCKEPPSSDRLAAMQILFEGCPCFKFGFMTANGAIMEAMRGEKAVHLVDFDINQGNQYITLLQSVAKQSNNKPPRIRLTGIDDPESVQRPIGGLSNIGQRLEKLAEFLGVPFSFRAVPAKASDVVPSMLSCHPGEALVVNFAFQLHHMPDESVSTVNERDQLLRMVKGLNPKLVTVVEQDINTNTTPFLVRFSEAYSYYAAVFESLDVTFPRDSQDRMNVEKQCLARDVVNVVACEGEERIERYEVAGKWRARMAMAGFVSSPISGNVGDAIRQLIKGYCDRYKVKEEMGSLCFGWEDKNLIVASAWK
nr:GRAS transcription factor 34 [Rheum palmatum]